MVLWNKDTGFIRIRFKEQNDLDITIEEMSEDNEQFTRKVYRRKGSSNKSVQVLKLNKTEIKSRQPETWLSTFNCLDFLYY